MRNFISRAGENLIPAFQLSLRAAVAAGLALVAAQLLRLEHPLYAMLSAVIVTDLVPSQTPKLALPWLAGTLVASAIGVRHHHPAAIQCLDNYRWHFRSHVRKLYSLSAGRREGGRICLRDRAALITVTRPGPMRSCA